MHEVSATFRDGQIILDTPVDWPEGTRILVLCPKDQVGMDELSWPDTTEGIKSLLARMDARKPVSFDAADQLAIDSARASARRFNDEAWERNARETEGLF